jgi:transaldolase
MELWLDTADANAIREIASWGVLSGVTTNPTLVGAAKAPFQQRLKEICAIVDGPVCGEVIATEADEMISQGRALSQIAPNLVVKLPITPAGLAACKALRSEGIETNMTLCFSVNQAVLVAEADATYVSPFLGRVDDTGNDGTALLAEIIEAYRTQGYPTKVLAASLRSAQHVADAARLGADVATMPESVFRALVKHPLTDLGLKRFLDDWAASGLSFDEA